MYNDDTDCNSTRISGSFYVLIVFNCITWFFFIMACIFIKSCRSLFHNNVLCLTNNNNHQDKNTVSTQTDIQLSTIVIHPNLDLGLI